MGAIIRDDKYRWPNGIIPFTVDPRLPDPGRVYNAIQEWQNKTIIRFIERRNFDLGYVVFSEETDPDAACNSPIGMSGRTQMIQLAKDCGTDHVIHEIGHIVGLVHEHKRSDRERYVEVYEANIQAGKQHNFTISSNDTIQNVGYYDYGSIMHYGPRTFGIRDAVGKAQKVLTPKYPVNPLIPNVRIGQQALSRGDINTVYFAYVCPEAYQPPRLQIGDHAFLDPKQKDANLVRLTPGLGDNKTDYRIQPGEHIKVLEGPAFVKDEKYIWWYVRLAKEDIEGWTAEAGEDGYWLVPRFT